MTATADTPRAKVAADIRKRFEERALAELAQADAGAPGSDCVRSKGALLAEVMLVKGLPGPAESSGGAALSGADGEAADKALEALGWDPADAFRTLSRPEPEVTPELRAARLRLQIEAVDPMLVLALDAEAAADVADAFGIASPKLGTAIHAGGRTIVAVDGLEASLSQPSRKKRVWRELQAAKPDRPVY